MSDVVTELRVTPGEWPEIVGDVDGPQLVVAGPGAGKTELLVRRAVHLLDTGLADPGSLLLLTFSRRAAADLRRRVRDRLAERAAPIEAATFHSFALQLVETFGTEGTTWEGGFPTLLTGPEQVGLVAELLAAEDLTAWPLPFRDLLPTPTFAADVADFLLRTSERLVTPEALRSSGRADWAALPGFLERYEAACRGRGRIDYAALVVLALAIASRHEVAERLGGRLRYLLVDEYQDTSPAQAELLSVVAGPGGNITVTADPYESIYGFRGTDVGNVARFPLRFRDREGNPARRIVLTKSFRVPAAILDGALRITRPGELPGAAGPVLPADHPGSVEAYVFDQASAEAEWIASEAERLHLAEGLGYRALAVLVRSKRRFLPELSRALDRRRIPHDTPDARLVDHPAVRIVLDTARAAAALAAGNRPDVRNILLGPLYGFPLAVERDLRRRLGDSGEWPGVLAEQPGTAGLAALLADAAWALDRPAADGFWHLWTTLDGIDRFVADPAKSGFRAAWSALSQVLDRQAERDPSLTLHDFALFAERDDFEATPLLEPTETPDDHLIVTTFHQSKGLEADVVFVADAVEGVFPDLRRGLSLLHPELLSFRDPTEERRFRLHEEMRLAYTAMTRARRRVVWTATAAGTALETARPSRFLHLAVGAGTETAPGPPAPRTGPPLTVRELEARLRRTAADPAAPAADRLASLAVLAHPPLPAWEPISFAGVRERGPDDGVLHPSTRLSPSAADMYSSCPRLFALGRIGIGDEQTTSATFGSLIHAVLERAERAAAADGLPHGDSSRALAELATSWDPEPFRPHPDVYRRRAEDLLTALYSQWPDDSAGIIDLERTLILEVGGFTWRGRVDRMEWTTRGTIRIVDYKTGERMPSKEAAASSLQLGFYLLAAREALGEEVAEAELWYPRGERKEKRRAFELANLPDVRARLEETAEAVRAERWDPTPGPACRWCRVKTSCPALPVGAEAFVS